MRITDTIRERLPFYGEDSGARRPLIGLGAILLVLLLLYYPIGMLLSYEIADDPEFALPASQLQPGQSRAVAIAAALLDREVNEVGWVANDPFFMPSSLLDNMPAYQQGVVGALARFAFELADQIGRSRGSSQLDPDLKDASGLLQYSGEVWVWDPSVSLTPTATSEAQYNKARKALESYNRRLAADDAIFERRADNLLATLDRIALDIGSSSAVIDRQIAEHANDFIDTEADDIFYNVKGQSYGYYLVLRALRDDFANVIGERDLETVYGQLLDSMHRIVMLQPIVVTNGEPDGMLLNSHLAVQGFYLLRARTQLKEITNILLK